MAENNTDDPVKKSVVRRIIEAFKGAGDCYTACQPPVDQILEDGPKKPGEKTPDKGEKSR